MLVPVRRQVALVITLLFAVVAVAPVVAGSMADDDAETQVEQGHTIDRQLGAFSVAPASDPVDSPAALALGAVRFRVEIRCAAPSGLILAAPEPPLRSRSRVHRSRARAPPVASRLG